MQHHKIDFAFVAAAFRRPAVENKLGPKREAAKSGAKQIFIAEVPTVA
jgi:hypothetical protein